MGLGTKSQIDSRRGGKSKGQSDADQIQLMNIKNIPVRMRGVCEEVAAIGVPGALIQIIIFLNEALQGGLYVG